MLQWGLYHNRESDTSVKLRDLDIEMILSPSKKFSQQDKERPAYRKLGEEYS